MRLDIADRLLGRAFSRVGSWATSMPWVFLTLPLVFAAIMLGVLRGRLPSDDHPHLFIPSTAPYHAERSIASRWFPQNASELGFDLGRAIELPGYGRVSLVRKDNVLTKEGLDYLLRVDKFVANITVEGRYTFKDVCARQFDGSCIRNWVFGLEPYMQHIEAGSYLVKYPLHITRWMKVLFLGTNIGGVVLGEDNTLSSAKAYSLIYVLSGGLRTQAWEAGFLQALPNLSVEAKFQGWDITWYTSQSLRREMRSSAIGLMPLFAASCLLLLFLGALSGWLSPCMAIAAALGTATSFFLGTAFGWPFISNNLMAIFLLMGVGLTEGYVLGAWWKASSGLDTRNRTSVTFRRFGPGMALSGGVLIGALVAALRFPLPAMVAFSRTTTLGIVTSYLFMVAGAGGLLPSLDVFELRRLLSCQKKGKKQDGEIQVERSEGPGTEEKSSLVDMLWMERILDHVGQSFPLKLAVLLLAVLIYGGAIYGATKLEAGFDAKTLFNSNSYAYKFYANQQKYFGKYLLRMQVIITGPLNYSDPKVQEELEKMTQRIEAIPQICPSFLTESWLRYYIKIMRGGKYVLSLVFGYKVNSEADFVRAVHEQFFRVPVFKRFKKDIIFNEDRTRILASRFLFQIYELRTSEDTINLLTSVRKIVQESQFNATVYNPFFGFMDQLLIVKKYTIETLLIIILITFVLSLIVLSKKTIAFIMSFNLFSVWLGIIGYGALLNIKLNFLTIIFLIVCAGFSLVHAAHVSIVYSKEAVSKELAKNMSSKIRIAILKSILTLLIGFTPLAFSNVMIFFQLYLMIAVTMLLSIFFTILLMPILIKGADSFYTFMCNPKDVTLEKDVDLNHHFIANKPELL